MKTQVIVQPGRCVRHEGKRRTEGAVLMVGQADLEAWKASGDVREAVFIGTDPADRIAATSQGDAALPVFTEETGVQAIDNLVAMVGAVVQSQAETGKQQIDSQPDLPNGSSGSKTDATGAPGDAPGGASGDAPGGASGDAPGGASGDAPGGASGDAPGGASGGASGDAPGGAATTTGKADAVADKGAKTETASTGKGKATGSGKTRA